MNSASPVSLGTIIEEALDLLYAPGERPKQLSLGADALTSSTSDTTFTLTGGTVTQSSLVEIGQEWILVTAVSSDADPVYTGIRGYAGTPMSAHSTGDAVLCAPQFGRYQIRRAVLRGIDGPIQSALPNTTTSTLTTVANQYYVEVPATTLDVLRVSLDPYTLNLNSVSVTGLEDIDNWRFEADAPLSSTGKLITVPPLPASTTLYVVRQVAYAWSGGTSDPAESEEVSLPLGASDLPALYAAAYVLGGREMSRAQLDRVEEWPSDQNQRQGNPGLNLAKFAWQQFYRRLDEARRQPGGRVPKRRPYRRMRVS